MPNTLGSGAGPSWPAEFDLIETYDDGTPVIPDGPKRADVGFANDTFLTLQRLEQTLGVNPQGASATVGARFAAHEAALDPHPQYLTALEGAASFDPIGAASSAVAAHVAASDPHTQYHTDARALTWLGTRSTTDLPEGTNLYFTDERVDDRVNALLVGGAGIDTAYNDIANTLTFTFDATELNDLTWGDGTDASIVWTFNQSGAVDPVLTFSNNLVTVTAEVLRVSSGTNDPFLQAIGTAASSRAHLSLISNTAASVQKEWRITSDLGAKLLFTDVTAGSDRVSIDGSGNVAVLVGDLILGVASVTLGRLLLYGAADAFPGILSRGGLTGSRTWTLPNVSGTIPTLENPNTFTANQTISNTAPSLVLTDTTAAAKSLTIAIDANLAQLRESAGASGSLVVLDLANNQVGLGTAIPSTIASQTGVVGTLLNVKGSAARIILQSDDGPRIDLVNTTGAADDKWMQVFTSGGTTKFRSVVDDGSVLKTNNILVLTLATGNVGIGTPSPLAHQHIYGTGGQQTAALTDAGSTADTLFLNDTSNLSGSGGAIIFGGQADKRFAAIKSLLTDGAVNTRGDLAFSTRHNAGDTALTERVRITAAGNLGIGTPNPETAVDANTGTIRGAAFKFSVGTGGYLNRKIFSMTGGAAAAIITVGAGPGMVVVVGYNSTQVRRFIDLVLWDGFNTSPVPTVVSTYVNNTPATRTYTSDGAGNLKLALSGTETYAACATIELTVFVE